MCAAPLEPVEVEIAPPTVELPKVEVAEVVVERPPEPVFTSTEPEPPSAFQELKVDLPPEEDENDLSESGPLPVEVPTEDEALPLDRIRERLRVIRHRAVEAGILSHELPPESPPPPPKPSFEAKVEAFARQVMPLLSAETRLLVLDAEGALLWSNDPQPGLVLSTLMALRSAEHSSVTALATAEALTHHELSQGQMLSVLRVPQTSRGPLQVAVKGVLPLPKEAAAVWERLLSAF